MSRALVDPESPIPLLIRGSMKLLIEEIRLLELRISQLEKELTALAKQSPACTTLLSIPGVGLLTATAMVAAKFSGISLLLPRKTCSVSLKSLALLDGCLDLNSPSMMI